MISKHHKKLLHVAKSVLKLSDDDYREILHSASGGKCESSADQRFGYDHYRAAMDAFRKLGFKPGPRKPKTYTHDVDPGARDEDWAHKEQLDKLCVMWQRVTVDPANWDKTLDAYLLKRFKIRSRKWIKRDRINAVIESVKNMYYRKILTGIYGAEKGTGTGMSGNKLLKSYKAVVGSFTKEELAMLLTIDVAENPSRIQTMRDRVDKLNESEFRKLTKNGG